MEQRDKTDKETQTKKRDKSRDKAKPGGRLPAYCGASCGARFFPVLPSPNNPNFKPGDPLHPVGVNYLRHAARETSSQRS